MSGPSGFCPVCGTRSTFVMTLSNAGVSYDVFRCTDCGLAFTGSVVPTDQVNSYYDKDYYDTTMCAAINPLRLEAERQVVQAQVRKLAKFIETPGRLLDVGCGDGVHLKLLREMGWEVYGTEISMFAARHVKREYGIDVWVGDLLNAPFEPGQFDVVQMRHVIEHLTDFRPTIAKAWELLRVGGLISIDTPNRGLVSRLGPIVDSELIPLANVRRRLTGRSLRHAAESSDHWGNLHPPEHNFWFTPQAMRTLLETTGFRRIWIKTSYRGHPDHYPSKQALRGEHMSWWDRLWLYMDALATPFGAGDILIAYGRK